MRLSEVVQRFGSWHSEGGGLVATCPAHEDSHPSLRVDVSADGHVLLACRAGCSTAAVMEAAGLGWSDLFNVVQDMDVVEVAPADAAVSVADRAVMAAHVHEAQGRLKGSDPLALAAFEYALHRFGVDSEQCVEWGLGVTADARLLVPFRDADGVVSGYQARAIGEHPVRWLGPKNPEGGGTWAKVNYSFDGEYPELVICEGPGDGLVARMAGYSVAAIRGAKLAASCVDEISYAALGRPIVVAVDSDDAGRAMAQVLSDGLIEAGVASVTVLELPDGVGDLGDWYEAAGTEFAAEFARAVQDAVALVADGVEEELPALDVSHLGLATAAAEWFGGVVRFVPSVGFHVYREGVWVQDDAHAVRRRVHEFRGALQGGLLEGLYDERSLLRAVVMLGDGYVIGRVMSELEAVLVAPLEWFDTHADKLVVRNGVIALRTGVLGPHDPDLFMTKKVDVDYVSGATSLAWEQFLDDVFPEGAGRGLERLPSYMQRLIGYGITGETKEQCFGVLYGTGANGKSVFTDTLRHVFDGIATTTPFSAFEERASGGIPNDIAALRGSRLVFASEGDAGKQMSEAVIKSITGQDMITARFMRKEFFSFKPTFLILMASNHKPRFRSQDVGLWRRVKLIPWRRFFEEHERDKDIFVKMQGEAEGILAWAVEGAIAWYAMGLEDPPVVVNATEGYKENSDPLSGFFPGWVEREEGGRVLASDVYKAYKDWCDEEELPLKSVWSRQALYDALEERGVERRKMKQGNTLFDVGLRKGGSAAKIDLDKIGELK